jgi:hypothetical protein
VSIGALTIGALTIGAWIDMDGPEVRAALQVVQIDGLPLRYLDSDGIPARYGGTTASCWSK